jgi:hypothetical protein
MRSVYKCFVKGCYSLHCAVSFFGEGGRFDLYGYIGCESELNWPDSTSFIDCTPKIPNLNELHFRRWNIFADEETTAAICDHFINLIQRTNNKSSPFFVVLSALVPWTHEIMCAAISAVLKSMDAFFPVYLSNTVRRRMLGWMKIMLYTSRMWEIQKRLVRMPEGKEHVLGVDGMMKWNVKK